MAVPKHLIEKALAGSYCTIGGCMIDTNADNEDRRCDVHRRGKDAFETQPMHKAEEIRFLFMNFCDRSYVPHIESAKQKRLRQCLCLGTQCIKSQAFLATELETRILEDGQFWQHCLFGIETDDGRKWAFDVTGIQFGPDWPLLQPFEVYGKERIARLKHARKLHSRHEECYKTDLTEEEHSSTLARFATDLSSKLRAIPPVNDDPGRPRKANHRTEPDPRRLRRGTRLMHNPLPAPLSVRPGSRAKLVLQPPPSSITSTRTRSDAQAPEVEGFTEFFHHDRNSICYQIGAVTDNELAALKESHTLIYIIRLHDEPAESTEFQCGTIAGPSPFDSMKTRC